MEQRTMIEKVFNISLTESLENSSHFTINFVSCFSSGLRLRTFKCFCSEIFFFAIDKLWLNKNSLGELKILKFHFLVFIILVTAYLDILFTCTNIWNHWNGRQTTPQAQSVVHNHKLSNSAWGASTRAPGAVCVWLISGSSCMEVCACDLGSGESETGGSLGLAGQPA